MEIPVDVNVDCSDGSGGKSIGVIVNPVNQELTHLIVQQPRKEHRQTRLVPIDWVTETQHDHIQLDCTHSELANMDPFEETEFVRQSTPDYTGTVYQNQEYMYPYATVDNKEYIPVTREHIPAGETALRRGASVRASDGEIGTLGELVITEESHQVTHFVLLEGHFWGKREVAVPVSEIDHVDDDAVFLKLDKNAVESLPSVPLRRHYPWQRT